MLRIAMITDYARTPHSVDGGVQAVTRYMIGGITRVPDIDLHVISFKHGIKTLKTTQENGYQQHVLPCGRFGSLTAYWHDQRRLNTHLGKIDPSVVHGQGAGYHGILAARSGYPAVITIHGIMAEETRFFTDRRRRWRHMLMNLLSEKYCIRGAAHTILISPYVADYFGQRLRGHQYSIPNPVADEFFNIERRENPGSILFAGRVLPLKGVVDLVAAASDIGSQFEIEVTLAGSLDHEEYVASVREEANRRGSTEVIRFRGLLTEAELREELARTAVLVLPSYQETAPMVIAEAMAAGVPVIATDVGGVRYMVRHGETGFIFKPGDRKSLRDTLSNLLQDSTLRQAIGRAAREFALSEYKVDSVVAKTVEVYRTAAKIRC